MTDRFYVDHVLYVNHVAEREGLEPNNFVYLHRPAVLPSVPVASRSWLTATGLWPILWTVIMA